MLVKLVVTNLALIDELELDFEPGLVVLTGETGAGKSLVLNALSLILGYRASTDLIRTGEEKALVQAVFSAGHSLPANVVDYVEDGQIIIAREINQNGRSTARVNDRLVTVAALRELGEHLVDLHGQHEHQSLLKTNKHREVLDRFAGSELAGLLAEITTCVRAYRRQEAQLAELRGGDEREQERRLDMLRFQAAEIAAAALDVEEEKELLAKRKRMANFERLHIALSGAHAFLAEGLNGSPGAVDLLAQALAELTGVLHLDQELDPFHKMLEDALYNMEDASRSLRAHLEDLTFDPEALQLIEQRLDLFSVLKRKYADSLAEVIQFGQRAEAEIAAIEDSAAQIEIIEKQLEKIRACYQHKSKMLTSLRQDTAVKLQGLLTGQLADLGLENAVLQPLISTKEGQKPQYLGQDEVEFLFSANPGEELKPLARVISGGEMSRIMLALKTLLAEYDAVDTLIFDEIDAGIGGRVAVSVAAKLKELAKKRQVICVSHLANIGALADQHFLISKKIRDGSTVTHVALLDDEERVMEIARMLGGQRSAIALSHARELLKR